MIIMENSRKEEERRKREAEKAEEKEKRIIKEMEIQLKEFNERMKQPISEDAKMIKAYCKSIVTFDQISEGAKETLISGGYTDKKGKFTPKGEQYKKAITAKPDPNAKIPDPFEGYNPS